MRIAGIIAEYDPFHLGHEYHVAETRRLSGCDFVVACMAGNFTQRGEAARLDKWARAEAALRCGVDAVFELPAAWVLRASDGFALGGVAILSGLGCDLLSFGCETGDMDMLARLAELGEAEPPELSAAIRRRLSEGKAYARAKGEATAELLGVVPELLNAPNLNLAVAYLRAIKRLRSPMRPLCVPRRGDYHYTGLPDRAGIAADAGDVRATAEAPCVPRGDCRARSLSAADSEHPDPSAFASASAIRRALDAGDIEAALAWVPEATREALTAAPGMHAPDDLLLYRLRSMTGAELAALPDVTEGLEHRLRRCAWEASGREELIAMLKCKRYTYARLSRLCAHALLGVTARFISAHPLPTYARLLGMSSDARALMGELSRRAALPIVSDPVRLRDDPIFALECRATDLRALCCDNADARRAGQEFTRKFVRV